MKAVIYQLFATSDMFSIPEAEAYHALQHGHYVVKALYDDEARQGAAVQVFNRKFPNLHYNAVASMQFDPENKMTFLQALNLVFDKTNNIDEPWTGNAEITHKLSSSLPSLRVGDLIKFNKQGYFLVDPVGFSKLKIESAK